MRLSYGTLIAAAALAAAQVAGGGAATAQAPAGKAYVVTYIEVTPVAAAQADATELLKAVAAASRREAGNERYDVLQRLDRQNQFAILETWADAKAAEAHAGGAAFRQFKDKLTPLRVSFYDERPSIGVAVAAAPAQDRDAVYVVTHVDVTPNTKDECIVMLRKLADNTRREPSALGFEAWQQNNRANHFTVTEVWKNRAAIDDHIAAAGTREFREKLSTMTGALYDERFYKSL